MEIQYNLRIFFFLRPSSLNSAEYCIMVCVKSLTLKQFNLDILKKKLKTQNKRRFGEFGMFKYSTTYLFRNKAFGQDPASCSVAHGNKHHSPAAIRL